MEEESKIILYTTPDGMSRVSLMSRNGRVWLNQKQMADLFAVSKMNISLHVSNILKEKALDDSVVKCYFTTATDGKKHKVIYYRLSRKEEWGATDKVPVASVKGETDEKTKNSSHPQGLK